MAAVPAGKLRPSTDEYRAPRWVWEPWHEALGFTLDTAASYANKLHPCENWITKEDNALLCGWLERATPPGAASPGAAWCNPPYSRQAGPLHRWVSKALLESRRGLVVCMLLPADTSTDWFTLLWDRVNGCWNPGVRGYFTDCRVRFIHPFTGKKTLGTPTFGSLVVVMSPSPVMDPRRGY